MPFADLKGQPRVTSCLTSALSRARLAHAYLFAGPVGSGKKRAARALAQAVLCQKPRADGASGEYDACADCEACHLVATGSHPDLEFFLPEEGKAAYPIKQVREEIRQHAYLKPAMGPKRFLVVERAEALVKPGGGQREGADTLLKLLEEPASDTVLILLASRPEQLPETVRSRCQLVRFDPPPVGELADLLAAEEKLSPDDAAFVARLSGGDLELARGFCHGRKKDKLDIGGLREIVVTIGGAVATMPFADLFALAADLDARARGWAVLSGTLGILADLYRDAAILATGPAGGVGHLGQVLTAGAGPLAEASKRLAGMYGPGTLARLALRALAARDDLRRYPARLLLLEVLLLDLRSLAEAGNGSREVLA